MNDFIPQLILFSLGLPFLIWVFLRNSQWSGDEEVYTEREERARRGLPEYLKQLDKDDY